MPIVTSGTDHHFDETMVWDNLGGAVRVRRNGTAQVLDPTSGTQVTVVQDGQSTSVVRSDANGRVTFVAQQGMVTLVSGGLSNTFISKEQATSGADNAAKAQTAQLAAETARDDAVAASNDATATLSQVDALAASSATIDELVGTFKVGIEGGTPIPSNAVRAIWVAPFDCAVTSLTLIFDNYTQAVDGSNYVEFGLRKNAATTNEFIVAKKTSSEGVTAKVPWTFAGASWNATNQNLAAGEPLFFTTFFTGTPGSVATPVIGVFRYRPA